MLTVLEKLAIGLACLLLVIVGLALFKGVPNALSAVMLGETSESPFTFLALVLMGWFGGFSAGRESRSSDGAMRLPQVSATGVFIGLLLWGRRSDLASLDAAVQATPSILVALTIWLLVVIGPWIAMAESEVETSRRKRGD